MTELEDEVALLEAMYPNESVVTRDEEGRAKAMRIELRPDTAMNASKQFVTVSLLLAVKKGYPETPVGVEVLQARGIDAEVVEDAAGRKAAELRGTPMLFEVVQCVRELLTESNVPSESCVVCLMPFEEDSADDIVKTPCTHFFHRPCLAGWAATQLEQHEQRLRDALKNGSAVPEPFKLPCPVCREDVPDRVIARLHLPPPKTPSPVAPPQPQRRDTQTADDVAKQQSEEQRESEEAKPGGDTPAGAVVVVSGLQDVRGVNGPTIQRIFAPYGAVKSTLLSSERACIAAVEFATHETAAFASSQLDKVHVSGQIVPSRLLTRAIVDEFDPLLKEFAHLAASAASAKSSKSLAESQSVLTVSGIGHADRTTTRALWKAFKPHGAAWCRITNNGVALVGFVSSASAREAIGAVRTVGNRQIACHIATQRDFSDC